MKGNEMTTIEWRKNYIQIVSNTRITTIYKKNVTNSTWKRFHKLVVNTPGVKVTSHSMKATI